MTSKTDCRPFFALPAERTSSGAKGDGLHQKELLERELEPGALKVLRKLWKEEQPASAEAAFSLPGKQRLPALVRSGALCEGSLLLGSDESRTTFAKRGGVSALLAVLQDTEGDPLGRVRAADTLIHLTRTSQLVPYLHKQGCTKATLEAFGSAAALDPDSALCYSCARFLGNALQADLMAGQKGAPAPKSQRGGAEATTHCLRVLPWLAGWLAGCAGLTAWGYDNRLDERAAGTLQALALKHSGADLSSLDTPEGSSRVMSPPGITAAAHLLRHVHIW